MEMSVIDQGVLDNALISFSGKAEACFQNINKRFSDLEERTCNSSHCQLKAAQVDDLLTCQSHRLKEKYQGILENKNETIKIAEEIVKCNNVCQQTSVAADSINSEVKVLQEDVNHKNKKINTKQEELTKIRRKVLNDIKLREDNIAQYSGYLGLQIHHEKGKTLIFTFKYISSDDPQKPFSFCFKVKNSGDYEVVDCQPKVSNVEKLVAELNETNNLKKFVLKMRKEFCGLGT